MKSHLKFICTFGNEIQLTEISKCTGAFKKSSVHLAANKGEGLLLKVIV